jgi:hypothetical protein
MKNLRREEMTAPLDGLGIMNALHERATERRFGGADRYGDSGTWQFWAKGKSEVLSDFTVDVVERQSDSDNSGYEHNQGWNGKCFMVFKVTPKDGTEAVFYRKDGSVDSYDGEHWDGKFYPVSPRVENVVVYSWDV